MGEYIKVKRGVRPYGGRKLRLLGEHTYPNGREVVVAQRPNAKHHNPIEYDSNEVEEVN